MKFAVNLWFHDLKKTNHTLCACGMMSQKFRAPGKIEMSTLQKDNVDDLNYYKANKKFRLESGSLL